MSKTQTAPAVIEPLLSVARVAALLDVHKRTIEKHRAAGRFPKPDAVIGRMPRWKPETIRAWIDAGGASA